MRQIKHIAIIPDGNRRWAKSNGMSLEDVYWRGCENMLSFSSSLFATYPDLVEISLFFVSYENLKFRKCVHLDPLFKSGIHFIDQFYQLSQDQDIELRWIGLTEYGFKVDSEYFYKLVDKIHALPPMKTQRRKLNVLIGYDVEHEINKVVQENGTFSIAEMPIKTQVDLVVRSGFMHRFSGFLPLNTTYSELVVLNKNFPEISFADIQSSIASFMRVQKNFGV